MNAGGERQEPGRLKGRLAGKHIVLGICGGIAAYKSAMLLRLLIKEGAEVQVVMTPAAKEFITPVTLSALSGKPVVSEFFTANSGEWHSHVDLGLWADLMVIAPATASTLAKMATGVADNMLVTTYLSAKEHVMVAPAMDLDMMSHPTTRRNLALLASDGVEIVEAATGELASGLSGKGRMEEPETIVERIARYFNDNEAEGIGSDLTNEEEVRDMAGLRVAVTAGPTYERLDPVRYIGNFSSGKMGYAIAREFSRRGAEVTLVSGPTQLPTGDSRIYRIDVESALEMHEAAKKAFAAADIGVFAAAVADYRPAERLDRKIKREGKGEVELALVANPDIAADCSSRKKEGQTFAGFALETDRELDNALGKMKRKNLDMIILNSLRDPGAGFRTDTNKVTIITRNETHPYPLKSKSEAARDIADALLHLHSASKGTKTE